MIILIYARNEMWLFPGLNAVCILICGPKLETRLTPCGQKSGQIQDLPFKPIRSQMKTFSLYVRYQASRGQKVVKSIEMSVDWGLSLDGP